MNDRGAVSLRDARRRVTTALGAIAVWTAGVVFSAVVYAALVTGLWYAAHAL